MSVSREDRELTLRLMETRSTMLIAIFIAFVLGILVGIVIGKL